MNIERLRSYVAVLEIESTNSELIRIQRRILIRLLNQLLETAPENRHEQFNSFWNRYKSLPTHIIKALDIYELRERSGDLLGELIRKDKR